MANDLKSARFWARELIENAVFPGAKAIDATMGNGYDTSWLCELVGEEGHVYAFDIQREAMERTEERLKETGLWGRAELFCLGHERMEEIVKEPVDAIVFNLGWLPGAEHGLTTRTATTIQAVEAAVRLLKEEALLTICVYPGHDEGKRELEALLNWAEQLDDKRFDAMLKCYLNQPNDPPQMIVVRKKKSKKK